MIHHLHTVDAHTAGAPLRLIVDGVPEPPGATMLAKREKLGVAHRRAPIHRGRRGPAEGRIPSEM